jgi:hypothetical protein
MVLVSGTLPPGRYASLTVVGPPSDLAAHTRTLLDWAAGTLASSVIAGQFTSRTGRYKIAAYDHHPPVSYARRTRQTVKRSGVDGRRVIVVSPRSAC